GFRHAVLTQDWHPAEHKSFATQHPAKNPFEIAMMHYGHQTLWPDHCVQGTHGAEFHKDLHIPNAELIIRKGFREEIDSYSAFFENDRRTPTGLGGYLKERGFEKVVCVGLAFDYCVRFSAEDARRLGFETEVIEAACRSIDLDGSADAARKSFQEHGIALA
uniref:nicotinamidase n=1 Tax=Aestuariivirga sp. TaxID=2650926 RepID=UPI0035B17068